MTMNETIKKILDIWQSKPVTSEKLFAISQLVEQDKRETAEAKHIRPLLDRLTAQVATLKSKALSI